MSMSIGTTIFTDGNLERFEQIHPGIRTMAEELLKVTNNPPFALRTLKVLLLAIEVNMAREEKQFAQLADWGIHPPGAK